MSFFAGFGIIPGVIRQKEKACGNRFRLRRLTYRTGVCKEDFCHRI